MKLLAYFITFFCVINTLGSIRPSLVKAAQSKVEFDVVLKSNDKKTASIAYQEALLSKTIMTSIEYNKKIGLLNNREYLIDINSKSLEILKEFIQKTYKNSSSPYLITYDIDKIFNGEKNLDRLLSKLDFLTLVDFLEIPILRNAIIDCICSKEVISDFENLCKNEKYQILSDQLKQEWAERITKNYLEKFVNLKEDFIGQDITIDRLWQLNKMPIILDNSFYVLRLIFPHEYGIYKVNAHSKLEEYVISISKPFLVCISDKLLASIADDKRTINIYDLDTKTLKKQLVSNYNSNIHSAILTSNFLTMADSNNVILVNLANYEINNLRIPGISGIALSPCQNFLAAIIDNVVQFFSIRDNLKDKSHGFYLYGKDLLHEDSVNMISFSPSGQFLATASENSARIWDVKTARCKQILNGHEDKVNSVVFSQCGNFLITTSNDRTIKIWNVFTGSMLLNLQNNTFVQSAKFTNDGNFLIAEEWGMANTKIYDLKNFKDEILKLPNLSLEQVMKIVQS